MNEELERTGSLSMAALKSGMARKTARKYRDLGSLPSQTRKERGYRTRKDPFAEDWSDMASMLAGAPELEAKTLFRYLLGLWPDRYEPGQLRTFQRRVKRWRAQEGPPKEVFFAQMHVPGEAFQTDFTHCDELGITIAREPFPHLLCQVVLPYSNWQSATVCRSESMAALRNGVQDAVFRLGRVPTWHQTDNSTAATHDLNTGKRGFNNEYAELMSYLGMKPRTTGVGQKEQNGDVESLNGALKRRLKQHLLVRGHSDFDSVAEYQAWVLQVLSSANADRQTKLNEELRVMRAVGVERLVAYTVSTVKVSSWSTIRVRHNSYSVPSRLIGESVRVRLYEDRLEVWHAGRREVTLDRLLGRNGHRVDYRHIIWSLIRKPGAFQRYRYREDLFPSVVFRKAYDALTAALVPRNADLGYLRLLHLAASTCEADVELAVDVVIEAGQVPHYDVVRGLVVPDDPMNVAPGMPAYEPSLESYDALLSGGAS